MQAVNPHPLVAKLRTFVDLPAADEAFIREISAAPRWVRPGDVVIRQTDDPDRVVLAMSGILGRYKSLPDGRRQIVGYMVPGDVSDLHAFTPKRLDDDVQAMESCAVVDFGRRRLADLYDRPAIAEGLYFCSQIDEATAREWILNVGRRPVQARLAHLLCELFLRLRMAGLTDGDACPFPLRTEDLADTTGLSAVQVSRALAALRQTGLLHLEPGHLRIPDLAGLKRAAGFSARYLQLDEDWGHGSTRDGGGAPEPGLGA